MRTSGGWSISESHFSLTDSKRDAALSMHLWGARTKVRLVSVLSLVHLARLHLLFLL